MAGLSGLFEPDRVAVVGATDRAEDIVRAGRTRDAATVERMGELLADHADLDALLGK